jgi:hypothetical protein
LPLPRGLTAEKSADGKVTLTDAQGQKAVARPVSTKQDRRVYVVDNMLLSGEDSGGGIHCCALNPE